MLLAVAVAVWLGRTGGATVAHPSPSGGVAFPTTQHSADRRELFVAAGLALIAKGARLAGSRLATKTEASRGRARPAKAREISATTLHERLNLPGPDDELTELADTFDALLDRLERSFASERRFVANASHELRTPLAGMRASLDVAMAKPEPAPAHVVTLAERLRRELDRMDALLESFLTLARTQQGPLADEATLSLAELACGAIEDRDAAISAQGLNVEQRPDPHAWVTGSAPLLARMVENVIENAIGHNQPDGWLRVCTAVERDARRNSWSRTAGSGWTPTSSKSSAGPSVAPAPIGPARTAAPASGWRSSPRSPRIPAARSTAGVWKSGGSRSSRWPPEPRRESARRRSSRRWPTRGRRLEDEGLAVDVAYEGSGACAKFDLPPRRRRPGPRPPGIHGDTLCRMITERENPAMVLMLTASGSPAERVSGLSLGADDYLSKPFPS